MLLPRDACNYLSFDSVTGAVLPLSASNHKRGLATLAFGKQNSLVCCERSLKTNGDCKMLEATNSALPKKRGENFTHEEEMSGRYRRTNPGNNGYKKAASDRSEWDKQKAYLARKAKDRETENAQNQELDVSVHM